MRIYAGMTDGDWFSQLAADAPDEVNFWRPSGRAFRAIGPGEPFLFKLHAPHNVIAGGGFFVRHTNLPASLAWEAFGRKNGVRSYGDLVACLNKYRRDDARDPMIGCSVLAEPFFFPRELWIDASPFWKPNIVSGRGFDLSDTVGARLWQEVEDALRRLGGAQAQAAGSLKDAGERYGPAYLAHARLGQGAFRVMVTDAYTRRCAVTGERTLPVLEAAHIRPFADEGPNVPSNGLLLRSDLHKLFDRGYMTVTPELRLEVSRRIREEFENGRDYYRLSGNRLAVLPAREVERPSRDFIEWHNHNVYRG